jgi:hypothetical protein
MVSSDYSRKQSACGGIESFAATAENSLIEKNEKKLFLLQYLNKKRRESAMVSRTVPALAVYFSITASTETGCLNPFGPTCQITKVFNCHRRSGR